MPVSKSRNKTAVEKDTQPVRNWDAEQPGSDFIAEKPSGRRWTCAVATDTLYAGFPHFHFYANPTFAVRFLDACRKESFRHAGAAETHGH